MVEEQQHQLLQEHLPLWWWEQLEQSLLADLLLVSSSSVSMPTAVGADNNSSPSSTTSWMDQLWHTLYAATHERQQQQTRGIPPADSNDIDEEVAADRNLGPAESSSTPIFWTMEGLSMILIPAGKEAVPAWIHFKYRAAIRKALLLQRHEAQNYYHQNS